MNILIDPRVWLIQGFDWQFQPVMGWFSSNLAERLFLLKSVRRISILMIDASMSTGSLPLMTFSQIKPFDQQGNLNDWLICKHCVSRIVLDGSSREDRFSSLDVCAIYDTCPVECSSRLTIIEAFFVSTWHTNWCNINIQNRLLWLLIGTKVTLVQTAEDDCLNPVMSDVQWWVMSSDEWCPVMIDVQWWLMSSNDWCPMMSDCNCLNVVSVEHTLGVWNTESDNCLWIYVDMCSNSWPSMWLLADKTMKMYK